MHSIISSVIAASYSTSSSGESSSGEEYSSSSEEYSKGGRNASRRCNSNVATAVVGTTGVVLHFATEKGRKCSSEVVDFAATG